MALNTNVCNARIKHILQNIKSILSNNLYDDNQKISIALDLAHTARAMFMNISKIQTESIGNELNENQSISKISNFIQSFQNAYEPERISKAQKEAMFLTDIKIDGDILNILIEDDIDNAKFVTVLNNNGKTLYKTYIQDFIKYSTDNNGKKIDTFRIGAKIINEYTQSRIDDFLDPKNDKINRDLTQRIMLQKAQDHPLETLKNIHAERQVFNNSNRATIFNTLITPFSDFAIAYKDDNVTQDEFIKRLNVIVGFMPKSVQRLFKSNIDTKSFDIKQQEFYRTVRSFLEIYNTIYVPEAQTYNQQYIIDGNGKFINVSNKFIDAPNYLQLLGSFSERKTYAELNTYEDTDVDEFVDKILVKFLKTNFEIKKKLLNIKPGDEINIDVLKDVFAKAYIDSGKDEIKFYKRLSEIGSEIKSDGKILEDFKYTGKKVMRMKQINVSTLQLDPAIQEVIKFYSMKAVADSKAAQMAILDMSYSDIEKNFNLKESEVEQFIQLVLNDEIPVSSFVKDAAKNAMRMLGLSFDKNINKELYDGVLASIESQIKLTILESGLMTETIKSDDKLFERHLSFFKINKHNNPIVEKHIDDAIKAINKLQYIDESEAAKMPLPVSSEIHVPYKVKNSFIETPKPIRKFIKEQQRIVWRYKQDYKDLYDLMNKIYNIADENERNKQLKILYKSYGYFDIEENINNIMMDDVKKYESKNNEIVKSLETLYQYYDLYKETGFLLPLEQVSNYRVQYANDMQPQLYKLIRSYIEQEQAENGTGHSYEMQLNDLLKDNDNPDVIMLKIAIAQAFDMDPDKNSQKTIIDTIDNLFDITQNGIIFNTNEPLGSLLDQYINGNLNFEEQSNVLNEIFNSTEGHHGLQAARLLRRIDNALRDPKQTSFNNDMTIETDAITSGVILTMMQVFDKRSINMLTKGGIYIGNLLTKWENYTKKYIKLKRMYSDLKHGKKLQEPSRYELETDNNFPHAALIEAGNFHQELKDLINKNDTEAIELLKQLDNIVSIDEIVSLDTFQDLYKTIGINMQNKIMEASSRIEDELSFLNEQIDNNIGGYIFEERKRTIESAITMRDFIGEITAKMLRSIAKPPTMEYNYGSLIGSVKRKLALSIGKEKLKDAINIAADLHNKDDINDEEKQKYQKAVAFVDAIMHDAIIMHNKNKTKLQFTNYNADTNDITIMTNDEISLLKEENIYKLYKHLTFDNTIIESLRKATDEIYGLAIEEAFKSMKSIDTFRNQIKSIELITFELFNARYELRKQKLLEEKGYISKKDIEDLQEDLRKEGFSHTSPTFDANNVDDLLDLTKTGEDESPKQASVSINLPEPFNGKINETSLKLTGENTRYTNLESDKQIPYTGAAPVTIIHRQDSRGITTAIGSDHNLSIYDAIVQSTLAKLVNKSTDKYNTIIVKQNLNKDVLHDNLNKLLHMLEKATDDELAFIKQRLLGMEKSEVISGVDQGNQPGTFRQSYYPKALAPIKKSSKDGKVTNDNIKLAFKTGNRNAGVRVYTQKTENGITTIKESFYTIEKSTGKAHLKYTSEKVIENDTMTITASYNLVDESKTKDAKTKKIAPKARILKYTIKGKDNIDLFNNAENYEAELLEPISSLSYNEITDITGLVPKENQTKEFLQSLLNSSDNNIPKTEYTPSIKPDETLSEGIRLGIMLENILKNIQDAPDNIRMRNTNILQALNDGIVSMHSGVSNTEGSVINMNTHIIKKRLQDLKNKKYETINDFIKDILNNKIQLDNKYIIQELEKKQQDKTITSQEAILLSYLQSNSNSNVFVIGDDIDPFKKIGKMNQLFYQYGSTIFVNIGSKQSVLPTGSFSKAFAGLDEVINNAIDINILLDIDEASFLLAQKELEKNNLATSTDANKILATLSRTSGSDVFWSANINKIVNFIVLNNLLINNGYSAQMKDGIILYESQMKNIDIDFNSDFAIENNIYSKKDLYNYLKKEVEQC